MTSNNLAEKKKSEIFAFLWATIAGLLFICLWSYIPEDIHFEVSNRNFPIHNYAGVAGAYIAWSLFFVFGKSSYFFVALLTFWSLSAWTGSKKQSVSMKLFSGTIFFVSGSLPDQNPRCSSTEGD